MKKIIQLTLCIAISTTNMLVAALFCPQKPHCQSKNVSSKRKRGLTRERIQQLHELRHPKKNLIMEQEKWAVASLTPITTDFEHSAPVITQKELDARRIFSMPSNVIIINKTQKNKDYFLFVRIIKNLIKSFTQELTKKLEFADKKNQDYLKTTDFANSVLGKNLLEKIDAAFGFLNKIMPDIMNMPPPQIKPNASQADIDKIKADVEKGKNDFTETLKNIKKISETYFNHTPGVGSTTGTTIHPTRKQQQQAWKQQRKQQKKLQPKPPVQPNPPANQQP